MTIRTLAKNLKPGDTFTDDLSYDCIVISARVVVGTRQVELRLRHRDEDPMMAPMVVRYRPLQSVQVDAT